MWNLKDKKKQKKNKWIYLKIETDTARYDKKKKKTCGYRGKSEKGGIDWEFGIDMYILLCSGLVHWDD